MRRKLISINSLSPTAIIERDLFTHILKKIVEKETSTDVLLTGSTCLKVQQTSYVNAIFTLGIGCRASIQIQILDITQTIESHTHHTSEIYS